MGQRAESVAETRRRILDASVAMFEDEGFRGTSVGRIASRADVTRATVYHHFGTKLGLLEALVADAAERAGLAQILEIGQSAESVEDVESLLEAFTRFWSSHRVLFRNVIGLAGVDPEAASVVHARDENRKIGIRALADRLEEEGALGEGITSPEAARALWLLTSFPVFDQLSRDGSLTEEQISQLLFRLAGGVFRRGASVRARSTDPHQSEGEGEP